MSNLNQNLGGFRLHKPYLLKDGQCPECLAIHKPEEPHNQESLFWQYHFMELHGRWPTWADAMSHCGHEMRAAWVEELAKVGVVVPTVEEKSDEQSRTFSTDSRTRRH